MRWTEDQPAALRILDDIRGGVRSGGPKPLPHATELIYCLTRSWYNRMKPLPPTEQETMLFSVGIGLEDVLLRPHRRKFNSKVEGIYFEVDFLDYDQLVGELKTTRVSAKKTPEQMPSTWTKQVLTYLHGVNVVLGRQETEALLVVLHLMGSYNPPFPILKVWRLKATPEEIEENWAWMQERKVVYMEHIEADRAPRQFTYNESWECEYCPYRLLCDAHQAIEDMHSDEVLVGD